MPILNLVLSKTLLAHEYCDIIFLLGCVFLLELLICLTFELIILTMLFVFMFLSLILTRKRNSVLVSGLL